MEHNPSQEFSVIIITHNHRKYIGSCLESVVRDGASEIILVDNCSTDNTPEYVRETFPDVILIESCKNLGFGRANNIGVNESHAESLVFLNPDTKVANHALRHLIIPLQDDKKTITVPKILTYDGSCVNTCGNIEHFTGLTFTRGMGQNPNDFSTQDSLNGLSGACFGIRKSDYCTLGGFDEDFFLYMEDAEFSWRAILNDLRILYVPESVICHDYALEVSPEKIYHLERGRYLMLGKHYSSRNMMSISPSLLLTEILVWGYSSMLGGEGMRMKLKAVLEGIRMMRSRSTPEAPGGGKLLERLDRRIPEDQLTFSPVDRLIKRFVNAVYVANLKVVVG